jgi:hypothetical protein
MSEQLWNSIPNSCSSQCPWASIYRLGAQMSVRQNIAGRRPDGGHGPSGRKTVWQDFLKISLRNLSCLRLRVSRSWGMNVQTAELQHAISISAMRASGSWEAVVRTVEVESTISILVARASGPRLTDVRTGIFELRFLPEGDARLDGILHRPDGWTIFPLSEIGKNLRLVEYREASRRMQAG